MKYVWLIIASVLLFAVTMGSALSVLDDAEMYLTMDDADVSSTHPQDVSGNNKDGVNNGATTGATGHILQDFDFDGTNDYVSMNIHQSLSSDYEWTLNMWVDADTLYSGGSRYIVDGWIAGTDAIYSRVNTGNVIYTKVAGVGDSSEYSLTTTDTLSLNTEHMITYYRTGNDLCVVIDAGTPVCVTLGGTTFSINQAPQIDLGRWNSGSTFWDGEFDEVSFYNRTLTSAEINATYLLTSNPYATPPTVGNYSITVVNTWNNTAVNNATVTVNGLGSWSNTTGNIIYTTIPINASNLFNINISAPNFILKKISGQNLSLNSTLDIYQTVTTFDAYELITNNNLSGATFTIGGQNNGTFYLSEGNHLVMVSKSGYYDLNATITVSALDNQTINITGLYDQLLMVNATIGLNGGAVSNITGWLSNTPNNYNSSFISGTIPTLKNLNYTVFLNPSGFNTNTENITTGNNTVFNYTAILYAYNSIIVTFRDSVSESLITNVSMDYFSDTDSGSNTTNNGSVYLTLLNPEEYTFRVNSSGYNYNLFFTTITQDSFSTITVYLNPLGNTTLITVEIVDGGAAPVENAQVKALKYYVSDNTYRIVASGITNPDGETQMNLVGGTEFYKFVVVYNEETVKTTTPFIITGTTIRIQILIGEDILETYYLVQGMDTSLVFNTGTNNFRFDFSDGASVNREVCLNTYRTGSLLDTLINTTCTTGTSATIIHSVSNGTGLSFYSKASTVINGETIILEQESYSFPSISIGNSGLLAQILLTLVISLSGFLAIELLLILAPLSIIIGGLAGLHTLQLSVTIPLLIVGVIIMFMLRRNT